MLELGSGFNPEYSGRDNVFLNGSILGLSRTQMEQRFDSIAAFADIGEFINRPVKTYSSGMFMRLAFAVATSVDAQLLLIDSEVTWRWGMYFSGRSVIAGSRRCARRGRP